MADGTREQAPTDDAAARVAERVAELLALGPDADPLARLRELAGETPGGAVALVDALGASRSADAVPVLSAAAAQGDDKELRKAARRNLHRLQSIGIAATLPTPRSPEPAPPAAQQLRLVEVHATAPDGLGSRVVWLGVERPYGGVLSYALVLNDVVGVKDCAYEETTRRRMTERMRDWLGATELTAVTLPGDYALALVAEALALNAETGFTVPRDFLFHRSGLGELPPPTDALIYRHVTRGQAFLLPDLLDSSSALLEEKELQSWFFGHDESLPFARELHQVRESRLILTAEPRETREQRTIDSAIDALFTPTMRRALRRRLEEVAYVFWTTGRERAARQAVAAAGGIGAGSLSRHPFARAFVEKSLMIADEADQAGIDPALLRRGPYDRME